MSLNVETCLRLLILHPLCVWRCEAEKLGEANDEATEGKKAGVLHMTRVQTNYDSTLGV